MENFDFDYFLNIERKCENGFRGDDFVSHYQQKPTGWGE